MGNLHNRITSRSKKENPRISKTAKFDGKILKNTENIVLRSLQILCIFVLREENVAIFAAISARKW